MQLTFDKDRKEWKVVNQERTLYKQEDFDAQRVLDAHIMDVIRKAPVGPLMELGGLGTGNTGTGAKSEKVPGGKRYIPLSAMEAVGAIFLEGVPKYGENNWKQGVFDRGYQMERWEHADRHLHLWAEGDRKEPHLAKVLWFCATQIELERLERVEVDEKEEAAAREAERPVPIGNSVSRDMYDQATLRQVDTVGDGGIDMVTLRERDLEAMLELHRMRSVEEYKKEQAERARSKGGVVAAIKEKYGKKGKAARNPMSEEGKARIAEAQRKRWARVRREKRKGGK